MIAALNAGAALTSATWMGAALAVFDPARHPARPRDPATEIRDSPRQRRRSHLIPRREQSWNQRASECVKTNVRIRVDRGQRLDLAGRISAGNAPGGHRGACGTGNVTD